MASVLMSLEKEPVNDFFDEFNHAVVKKTGYGSNLKKFLACKREVPGGAPIVELTGHVMLLQYWVIFFGVFWGNKRNFFSNFFLKKRSRLATFSAF